MADKQTEAIEHADAADNLPPITLAAMKLVAMTVASDFEDDEARMAETLNKRPDPAKLEQARVLRKVAALIDRIVASPQAREALGLRSAAKAGGDA